MTTGSIPADWQPHPLLKPNAKVPFVYDERGPNPGHLHPIGQQLLQQLVSYVSGTSRIVPCSASGTNNITLTENPGGPLLGGFAATTPGYVDYEVYSFVAAATTTDVVTAQVVTARMPNTAAQTLSTLKVYKSNGAAQAGSGDLNQGCHYTVTFVDSLDSGTGGFVLR